MCVSEILQCSKEGISVILHLRVILMSRQMLLSFDDTPFFVTPATSDSNTNVSTHVVHISLFETSISTH